MDYEGLDLNLLLAFDALIAERHVTRAARRIGVSQPAMSSALSRLRRLTKDELFVRSTGGFAPTPRAMDLARPVRHALETIGQAFNLAADFEPATSQAVLTIALSDHPTHRLLPHLAARISALAPHVDIRARSFRDRHDAITLLDEGSADVAVGLLPGSEARILHERLFEERFVGIARSDRDGVAKLGEIEHFVAATHLLVSPEGDDRGIVDEALAKLGRARRIGFTVAAMYAAPTLVRATDLVAVVMEGVVAASGVGDALTVFAPPVELSPVTFHLLWHRRGDSHPAHRWLREQVRYAAQATTTIVAPDPE